MKPSLRVISNQPLVALRISKRRELPDWAVELIAWPLAAAILWGLWEAGVCAVRYIWG